MDFSEEKGAAVAIAHPMIGGEAGSHGRNDAKSSVDDTRLFGHATEADQCHLRRINDAEHGLHA